MQDSVEVYFSQLSGIYNSRAGVPETTYYPPLCLLLDAVGSKLKPKVTAIAHPKNTGAGIPDVGMFTAEQLRGHGSALDAPDGQRPKRGVIEVKGTSEEVACVAASEQVAKYVEHYGLVLVTNLRDFVLVGRDLGGSGIHVRESFSLAASEAEFWQRTQQPRKFAKEVGAEFDEFLQRVLRHNAPLVEPKDLAWFLASYARQARLRLEARHDLPALAQLRSQLEESLGMQFEGEKGDHFFRSTLVQTLFYGMFASWVLWAKQRDHTDVVSWSDRFQWETATQTLHVPMVYELFHQFADVRRLGELGLFEVLEWAEEVLFSVDRASFFQRFQDHHAVQYFYEPFLEAFDPQLRRQLGVWYTPEEVVRYMVARVDRALKDELGIEDGLADPSVVVLDPCCGTGAYLVEVLQTIERTLRAKGGDALTSSEVKTAAKERIFGFEIMPAPFVIAHLQLGVTLADMGAPLQGLNERAAVYLTNALTGWGDGMPSPPRDRRVGPGQMHSTLLFEQFAEERDAANRVKREERVLVVIGNPPYSAFAGTSPDEEEGLVEAYKAGLSGTWGVKKYNLDDLFVRFFRLAERAVADRGERGVVCLISNSAWTSGASFTVMRERLLKSFDEIWVDNLNGDSRETGKLTPDGKPDPSVFSTERNREGIRVGTAVGLLIRKSERNPTPEVRYRDFWGATKRADLLASLDDPDREPRYQTVNPVSTSRFTLKPSRVGAHYLEWPRLTDLCIFPPVNGLMEKRGGALIDIDREALEGRMRKYFDSDVDWAELSALGTGLTRDAAAFQPRLARAKVLAAESFNEERLVRYAVRPFEDRFAYYSAVPPLWNRARPTLFGQLAHDNAFVASRPSCVTSPEGVPLMYTSALGDNDALRGHAYYFPLMALPAGGLLGGAMDAQANLSQGVRTYLAELGLDGGDERSLAGLVWHHVLAVGYAPAYLSENSDGVHGDWLRVPLPGDPAGLESSAALGALLAKLLDPEAASFGLDTRLEHMAALGTLDSRASTFSPDTDLGVTAHWAIAGAEGRVMPSTGKTEGPREYTPAELTAIGTAAQTLGMELDDALQLLGATCLDVYLNDSVFWRGVPANVWTFTVGGFQVIKKWLSYRERALLGRDLKPAEARHVTDVVRRIAMLLLLQPQLDENYAKVKGDAWSWPA